MKYQNIKLFICLPALFLTSNAVAEQRVDKSIIEAEKVHEVCMKLKDGQKMNYSFKSAKSMKFNIHYHADDVTLFPVEEHLTDGATDIFISPGERGYCMMWTNPNAEAVELNVEYEIQ